MASAINPAGASERVLQQVQVMTRQQCLRICSATPSTQREEVRRLASTDELAASDRVYHGTRDAIRARTLPGAQMEGVSATERDTVATFACDAALAAMMADRLDTQQIPILNGLWVEVIGDPTLVEINHQSAAVLTPPARMAAERRSQGQADGGSRFHLSGLQILGVIIGAGVAVKGFIIGYYPGEQVWLLVAALVALVLLKVGDD